MKKVLAAFVIMCLVTASAIAGIARTDQTWSFSTSTGPVNMESDNPQGNEFGLSRATISTSPSRSISWNQNGWWEGELFNIVIEIFNNPLPNAYKRIEVDMVFQGDLAVSPKWIVDGDGNEFTRLAEESSIIPVIGRDGWFQAHEVWRIEPNPDWEKMCFGFVGIDGGLAALDSITVTTWCIPEPATLGLLAVGAVGLFRKRK